MSASEAEKNQDAVGRSEVRQPGRSFRGTAAAQDCTGRGDVFRYGNWECGTPSAYSPWANMAEAEDYSFQRVTDNVRQGSYAGRFEVRPGDDPNDTGGQSERAEAYGLTGTAQTQGDVVYYAFSTYFPTDWPRTDKGCCIVAQWRANNWTTGWPPLMLNTPHGEDGSTGDRLGLLQRSGTCELPPNQTCERNVGYTLMTGEKFRRDALGKWHDWIIYVEWSANRDGRLAVWHRAEDKDSFTRLMDVENIETLKAVVEDGQRQIATVYSKYGIYRTDPQPEATHVMYNDSYCVARWYDAARSCFS